MYDNKKTKEDVIMKRFFTLFLVLCALVSLAACGNDTPVEPASANTPVVAPTAADPTDAPSGGDDSDPQFKLAWDVGTSAVTGGFDTLMDRGTYTLLGKECRLFYYVKDTHFVGECCVAPDGTVYVDLSGQLDWMYAEKNVDGTYRLTPVSGSTPSPAVTKEPEDDDEEEDIFVPEPTPYIPSAGNYVWPVPGFNYITYRFGEGSGHSGVDISGSEMAGTPVCAIADGYVSSVEMNEYGLGLCVTVIHDNGDVYSSLYAQLDSAAVEPGDSVSAGETIAYVGMSGDATGYHLHLATFATEDWSSKFDPLALYPGVELIIWDDD